MCKVVLVTVILVALAALVQSHPKKWRDMNDNVFGFIPYMCDVAVQNISLEFYGYNATENRFSYKTTVDDICGHGVTCPVPANQWTTISKKLPFDSEAFEVLVKNEKNETIKCSFTSYNFTLKSMNLWRATHYHGDTLIEPNVIYSLTEV